MIIDDFDLITGIPELRNSDKIVTIKGVRLSKDKVLKLPGEVTVKAGTAFRWMQIFGSRYVDIVTMKIDYDRMSNDLYKALKYQEELLKK